MQSQHSRSSGAKRRGTAQRGRSPILDVARFALHIDEFTIDEAALRLDLNRASVDTAVRRLAEETLLVQSDRVSRVRSRGRPRVYWRVPDESRVPLLQRISVAEHDIQRYFSIAELAFIDPDMRDIAEMAAGIRRGEVVGEPAAIERVLLETVDKVTTSGLATAELDILELQDLINQRSAAALTEGERDWVSPILAMETSLQMIQSAAERSTGRSEAEHPVVSVVNHSTELSEAIVAAIELCMAPALTCPLPEHAKTGVAEEPDFAASVDTGGILDEPDRAGALVSLWDKKREELAKYIKSRDALVIALRESKDLFDRRMRWLRRTT